MVRSHIVRAQLHSLEFLATGADVTVKARMSDDVTKQLSHSGFRIQSGELKDSTGRKLHIGLTPVTIGRSPNCSLQLDGPDISAVHCEVSATQRGLLVRDLGSTNGTQINSVWVTEGTVTRPSLLTLGSTELTLTLKNQDWIDSPSDHFGGLYGQSEAMQMVFKMLSEVSASELSVLLSGETGSGKEVAAKAIHDASSRKQAPFVVLDCTSVPSALAESILFGHEKGAFTGAVERRPGVFHEADGGTLFLDELGELPAEIQPKLLRALAERKVKRVGATQYESVDVRLIAATLRDMTQRVNQGAFRSDVYFRLAQVRVRLPALRTRLEDIPLLVLRFCEQLGRSERADEVLGFIRANCAASTWPGNVRELFNVVQLVAQVPGGSAVLDQLVVAEPLRLNEEAAFGGFVQAKNATLAQFEKGYFEKLCTACQGNVSEMARQSGLGRHHVRQYLRRHHIAVEPSTK
jgi:DNA-binding NtrC family response regulator